MRCFMGLVCVLALGVMPMVGCSETGGDGGSGGMGGDGGSAGSGGMGGDGGTGGSLACEGNVCPCSEAGIRAAIEAGGAEPYTFSCNGPQTVVTAAEIVIDNDVILDGEGNLTVDGDNDHRVFSVPEPEPDLVTAELRGFLVTGGSRYDGGGIANGGTLTLTNCAVLGNQESGLGNSGTLRLRNSMVSGNTSDEHGGGIFNVGGTLTLTNSTVSGNTAQYGGGGISNLGGTLMLTNSTVSGNTSADGGGIASGYANVTLTSSTVSGNTSNEAGGGISHDYGTLTLANSTVSGNSAPEGAGILMVFGALTLTNSTVSGNTAGNDGSGIENIHGELTLTNTLVDDDCGGVISGVIISLGYNVESPGDTCGFDQTGDQSGVTAEQLNLGPLANNGGPTMTLKPGDGGFGDGSDAIDQIPVADCGAATDQRGQPRPEAGGTMCDVGAVEVQVLFSCTEQGIRDAIAAGGGPHTFACNGATTVVTQAPIEIDNDVILNGAGELTVDGDDDHYVFSVPVGVTAELQGFTVTNGVDDPNISGAGGIRIDTDATVTLTDTTVSGNTGGWAGGITNNRGTLTLSSSTVSDNTGSGIVSTGPLTLRDSTVSGNVSSNGASGGGIVAYDITLLVNSTISGNSSSGGLGGAINTCEPLGGGCNPLTLISSTISGNIGEPSILVGTGDASMSATNSLVDGDCDGDVTSNGYNIESPGDTCGFDTNKGDQVNVSTEDLNLGPLQNNGGPTMTHALQTVPVVSAAIDQIPEADCGVTTDQRGVFRPQSDSCDVGAFELEVGP